MSTLDLIRRLDDLGVALSVVDERIRWRSNGALPPALLTEMKQHRDELLDLLTRRAALTWPPPLAGQADGARRGPLTHAQQTLLATEHFLDDGTYNLCGALRLRGWLDRDALLAALADLHVRHAALRTVFPLERGEATQLVLPEVAAPVRLADLAAAAEPFEECLRDCVRLADEKLPLRPTPPVRMRLFRLGEQDHVFFVVLHHILADNVAVGLLVDDLARCYAARLVGDEPPAAAVELDMIEVARWESERLACGDLSEPRRYWRDRLRGAELGGLPLPPPLTGASSTRRTGARTITIDAATTTAVRELASANRASVFVAVGSAVATVLSRYTGRDDLVLGMPVGRRDRPGLAHLVGPLLDMVPVRLDLTGAPSFADLLARTRKAVLGALRHADLPVEAITGGRGGHGDAAGRGLFNVILTDLGTGLPAPAFTGLTAEYVDVAQVGAKYDLNFLVRDDGDTLAVEIEFDPRVVAEQDVAAMGALVRRVLGTGAAHPAGPVADLATAPFGEPGNGAVGEAPPRVPGPAESLPQRLFATAERRGRASAVRDGEQTLSYHDFATLIGQLAAGLRADGVRAGDIVAIALPRGIDLVVAITGVMAAGAACVVLDDSWPDSRIEKVLTDSGACRVLGTETGQQRIAALVELGSGAEPAPPVPADAVAYVIYTSGSTGNPKGVHVTHANLLSLLDATGDGFGLGADDVWTLFHACSFDVAMYELFGCLTNGGTLVVVPKPLTRDPDGFAALLGRHRVTVLSQTPSALSVMLPSIAANPEVAESVRYILFAGEALDRRLAEQWYRSVNQHTRLVNLYGTTETTVHASWHLLRPDERDTAESAIGVPLPGTCLHVLHDNGTSVLNRCVGEIYVGGPQVSLGYLGRARETALRFVPDPFGTTPGARLYRTGDLARRDGTRLAYLGRRDAQVQVNGFRVELSEVESALVAQPSVESAGAAVSTGERVPRLVAVVVPKAGATPEPVDLVRATRRLLPGYMVPHVVRLVPELPLTANGKLDRAAVLAVATEAGPDRPAEVDEPADETEALLVRLFREVLHGSGIGTRTDFFDAGGDSMHAIRLVGLAREHGIALTVGDVYAAPRPVDLAAHATHADAEPARPEPFGLLPPEAGPFAADVVDAYPMTALQSGMIYHQEIAPDARVYHIVLSYRVRGAMDADAFRAATRAVAAAHPILRTSFDLANPHGPIQRVHAAIEPALRCEDLRGLDEDGRAARVRAVVDEEIAADFRLDEPGLFRLVVLVRSDADYQLVFSHHHAILDGWSVNVFVEDLRAQYAARLTGGAVPELTGPPVAFADYVALERRALESTVDGEFWRRRIEGPRSLVAPERAASPLMRQVHLSFPGLVDELRAVASRAGVPLKALLCAAHVRVLAWLTGRDEVLTSRVCSGRPEAPGADRMAGLFLNQLPFRSRIEDGSWAELAAALHADEQDMLPHRWYPGALIQREAGGGALFDTSFNFTDYHTTRALVRDGSIEFGDTEELESTHYALGTNYTIDVRTGDLRLLLEYDEHAIGRPVAELAARAHRSVLLAIAENPDARYRAVNLPGVLELAASMAANPVVAPRVEPVPVTPPGPAAPDEVERLVREVWAEVLGVEVDPHTSFFAAGGDSLAAMQVVSRLRARHGKLSMRAFLQAPTIAEVARALVVSGDDPVEAARPVAGPRRVPLTGAQRQIWSIASRLPDLPLFGIPGALRVDGPLDVDVLRGTLADLARRHEALRTRIEVVDAEPVQVVEPTAAPVLDVRDLRGEADPSAECERLMARAVRAPVDTGNAPMLRTIVFRLGDNQHVLLLIIHHLIADGWSLARLLDEAADTYRRIATGEPIRTAPALGSAELAERRARWLVTETAADQREYWLRRLAPPWAALSDGAQSRFPAPKQVPFGQRLRVDVVRRRFGVDAVDRLRSVARRTATTEFMLLLGGFAQALRDWTGRSDVRVGTMLANRAEPGTEEVVGLLANTVVLRLDVPADRAALLDHVRDVCLDAYEHQELPFEDVLASLGARHPDARLGGLYDVMLVLQKEFREVDPNERLRFGPYRPARDALRAPIQATTCEFVLFATEWAGQLMLELQYRPATTDREIADALLADVAAHLAETIAALDPES